MKYTILLLILGIWIGYLPMHAQEGDSDVQFVYHYGVLLGHDWDNLHLSRDITTASVMVQAMRDVAKGTNKISREQAFQSIENQTVKNDGGNDQYNLSYCHGVIIGSDWQMINVPIKEVTLSAFVEGIESVIRPSSPVVEREVAQLVITKRYQQWHQAQATQQIIANKAFLRKNRKRKGVLVLSNGIQYEFLEKKRGARVGETKAALHVYYTCTLTNGQYIESVEPPTKPMIVTLDGVLPGWKVLLPLMRKGETIKAYLPSEYGYGGQQHGKVPPNSILVYELTLVDIGE